MNTEILEVKTRAQLGQFVRFPIRHFKGNPYYCPDLIMDELNTLDWKKNPAYSFCQARYWLAKRDGKIVGRIGALLSEKANETWGQKRMRFMRVDFIDDDEVVDLLFGQAENWARELGCEAVHGPLGFCDLDREGMLIEGFDELDMMITIYAYPYYKTQMERIGYGKDVDWIERLISVPKELPEKLRRVSEKVKDRYGVKVFDFKTKKELLPKVEGIFDLWNEAYKELYGVVALPPELVDFYVEQFLALVQPGFLRILMDQDDRILAFGLAMPSFTQALQKSRGRLFPFGLLRILRACRKNDRLDMFLIAVRPELKNSGLNAILFTEIMKSIVEVGIQVCETGPMLEENVNINLMWDKNTENRQHRRRRCFIKYL